MSVRLSGGTAERSETAWLIAALIAIVASMTWLTVTAPDPDTSTPTTEVQHECPRGD